MIQESYIHLSISTITGVPSCCGLVVYPKKLRVAALIPKTDIKLMTNYVSRDIIALMLNMGTVLTIIYA